MRTLISTLFFCCIALANFAAAPTVTSFAPSSARTGATVTITGTNFTPDCTVSFGGMAAASVSFISSTQITAVVGQGNSGLVSVTNIDGTGTRAGFIYLSTTRIITDFGSYWSSTLDAPNNTTVDSSHMLLGFTYRGDTYSTGVRDATLTSRGVSFIPGNFRALPVANISGTTGATSVYIALAEKVDGSKNVAYIPNAAAFTLRNAMTDGLHGLDLGTGFTNLPVSALLTFAVHSIDPAKIDDDEPDIILTQIAQPVSGNDQFGFVDALGAPVGTTVTQDMFVLPKFGSYDLDLYTLTPSTPYNAASVYGVSSTSTNREIRVVAFRLSDFNINAGNVGQIKALKITPSSNSDYAFIAYNANSINLPPNVSQNDAATHATICSGGTANLSVLVTPALGGSLSYSWEQSVDGGTNWTAVSNGGGFSGALTNTLSITGATDGYQYRAIVQETGNSTPATSLPFTITVNAPSPPTAVSVSGGGSFCLHTPVQLTSSVTGGSNLYYQWEGNASGSYADIPGANFSSYVPPVNQTGAVSYRLRVSSGSGCSPLTAATPATVTITGIASVTPTAVCTGSPVSISATTTSGTVSWYDVDVSGSSLYTGNTYAPAISSSKTYYAASSACPSALRIPVVATVYPTTAGGAVTGGTSVITGTNSTVLTLNSNTGSVLKWQSSTDEFNTSIVDIPNTSSQLTVTNLTQTTQYRTEVKSGTCPSAFSGFATMLVTGTLAVRNNSLHASRQGTAVLVQWTATDISHTARFEVERSADGISFIKLHTVYPGVSSPGSPVTYKWLDGQPLQGNNFYRIRDISSSGGSTLTSVVNVLVTDANGTVTVYPNPVTDGNLQLQLNGLDGGNYTVNLYNTAGQKLLESSFSHTRGSAKYIVHLPSHIVKGVYKLELIGPAQLRKHFTVLIR
jgi:hypothetical protein